jgi:hypothetical protein
MNRVDFTFDNATHYALYEIVHLDGSLEYYLELRDRLLISEFGLVIQFKRDPEGRVLLPGSGNPRKKALVDTILLSIDQAVPPSGNK